MPETVPRPDVPDELIVRAAKASSVHFENCDDGETWQDCPDCRRAYDRAHYALAAVVTVIERQVRERVAAESAVLDPKDLAELLNYVIGREGIRVVQEETLDRAFVALKATQRGES